MQWGVFSCPNARLNKLPNRCLRPAAVGGRTGWTGMQDPSDPNTRRFTNRPSAFGGKPANPNQPFRLQDFQDPTQMRIANGEEARPFSGGELVRCEISSAGRAEGQGTVIRHEMTGEKSLRRAEPFSEKSPEPPAADL